MTMKKQNKKARLLTTRFLMMMTPKLRAELEAEALRLCDYGYRYSVSALVRRFCADGLLQRQLKRREEKLKKTQP